VPVHLVQLHFPARSITSMEEAMFSHGVYGTVRRVARLPETSPPLPPTRVPRGAANRNGYTGELGSAVDPSGAERPTPASLLGGPYSRRLTLRLPVNVNWPWGTIRLRVDHR
jgi:hypothetical protein